MTILIDSTAYSVISSAERIAAKYGIPCHIYCNTDSLPEYGSSELHYADKSKSAANSAIINNCGRGDIIVTRDSGLAALALTKGAAAISPGGVHFTDENIMLYLNNRYAGEFARRKYSKTRVRGRLIPCNAPKGGFRPAFSLLINQILQPGINLSPALDMPVNEEESA